MARVYPLRPQNPVDGFPDRPPNGLHWKDNPNYRNRRSFNVNPTRKLHELGQRLWLDNITRGLLNDGTLDRYIRELAVTGLTSNPTIFNNAIQKSGFYDEAIREKSGAGLSVEDLFFDLALEDLSRAADLFRPIHDRTDGVDGWVSLEVSPLLAHDAEGTIAAAKGLYARAQRPNLFIKIPGTMEGVTAIEEVIFSGVPVNVTLLFSREHYLAAAGAYMRGIGRRIAAGLDPRVASVASVFISRWDVAANRQLAEENHNRLGIAIAGRTYKAYRESLSSRSWEQLAAAGARPQRLLWASTGTKDPKAPDDLYVESLIAPETINTLPENTLLAVGDHGRVGELMREDGGSAEQVIRDIEAQGVDVDALAARLQDEGAAAFEQSWTDLMECIASKG